MRGWYSVGGEKSKHAMTVHLRTILLSVGRDVNFQWFAGWEIDLYLNAGTTMRPSLSGQEVSPLRTVPSQTHRSDPQLSRSDGAELGFMQRRRGQQHHRHRCTIVETLSVALTQRLNWLITTGAAGWKVVGELHGACWSRRGRAGRVCQRGRCPFGAFAGLTTRARRRMATSKRLPGARRRGDWRLVQRTAIAVSRLDQLPPQPCKPNVLAPGS